jgi:hypothetical protein
MRSFKEEYRFKLNLEALWRSGGASGADVGGFIFFMFC